MGISDPSPHRQQVGLSDSPSRGEWLHRNCLEYFY